MNEKKAKMQNYSNFEKFKIKANKNFYKYNNISMIK